MSFKKSISLDTAQLIWRMLSDTQGTLLLLEVRNPDSAEVSFTLIDIQRNKLIFEGLFFEETWWVSSAVIEGDLIIFYTYDDDQNPSSKTSFCYNYIDNEVVWQKEGLHIESITDNVGSGFYYDNEELKPTLVDLLSGQPLASSGSLKQTNSTNRLFPVEYSIDSEHYPMVSSYIQQEVNMTPTKEISYLESPNGIILSFYVQDGKGMLSNFLMVAATDGEIVLFEQIGTGLSGVAQDSFFILSSKLIFINKKTEICIYEW